MRQKACLAAVRNIEGLDRSIGDVRESLADITQARTVLGYEPQVRSNQAHGLDWNFHHRGDDVDYGHASYLNPVYGLF